ncbi:MAG: hypothetical protein D3926_00125 [Desulfobacteraceae bacterium]|nr:MAG: hypothetical protein D3926_00125 [Desulfobacteraceae bacterium]
MIRKMNRWIEHLIFVWIVFTGLLILPAPGMGQAVPPDSDLCTVSKIERGVVYTSCKTFLMSETLTITDYTDDTFTLDQIPLPCEAMIDYVKVGKDSFFITGIRVHEDIKALQPAR